MPTIDVDAREASTLIPELARYCDIIGSVAGPAGTIRLIIDGGHIPDGHVSMSIDRMVLRDEHTVLMKAVFNKVNGNV